MKIKMLVGVLAGAGLSMMVWASAPEAGREGDAAKARTAERLCRGAADVAVATEGGQQRVPGEIARELKPGSPTCRALAEGTRLPELVRSWLDQPATAKREVLSLDRLMGDTSPQSRGAASPDQKFDDLMGSTRPAASTITIGGREVATAGPSSPQLDFADIEHQREAIKTEKTKDRVEGLATSFDAVCSCVDAASACFPTPSFGHDELNSAIADEAGIYEQRMVGMCSDWKAFAQAGLPADRAGLEPVAQQLQAYLDARVAMHDTLRTRTAEFRAEEQRIDRARAEAQAAAAQPEKKSGFLASMITLGAGAVLANKLDIQIDPDALAKTSIRVGTAVRDGEGAAGVIGAGVTGFDTMLRNATPIAPPSGSSDGGDLTASAMQQVKRFPVPGPTGSTAGATGGAMSPPGGPAGTRNYADLMGSSGTGTPANQAGMPPGVSADSAAQANAYLQKGQNAVNSGAITPGSGKKDAFGVPDPTREHVEYVCHRNSRLQLGGKVMNYEQKISMPISYWRAECGAALKEYVVAYGCNKIDDLAAAQARCEQACGSPDCRDVIFENQILSGGALQ